MNVHFENINEIKVKQKWIDYDNCRKIINKEIW